MASDRTARLNKFCRLLLLLGIGHSMALAQESVPTVPDIESTGISGADSALQSPDVSLDENGANGQPIEKSSARLTEVAGGTPASQGGNSSAEGGGAPADAIITPTQSEDLATISKDQLREPVAGQMGASEDVVLPTEGQATPSKPSNSAGQELRLDQLTPLERARYYARKESYQLAERVYVELIEQTKNEADLKSALLELSQTYYDSGQYMKAIEIFNQMLNRFSDMSLEAEYIYRLGELYQAAGFYDKAISVFFEVINTVVITGSEELDEYLPVARMAQFQIARSNYEKGDYRKAFQAFDRIDVLELSRENREVVLYYEIVSAVKAGEISHGKKLLEEFFDKFPGSEYTRELTYIAAELAMIQGQPDDATELLVGILESFDPEAPLLDSERLFWTQQAGNRLANRFYVEGDYAVALRIYQGLLGLSDSKDWQLRIVYQMALCFEKLGFYDRAEESYTYLLEDLNQLSENDWNRSLRHLKESALWRSEVLQWRQSAKETSSSLLNEERG